MEAVILVIHLIVALSIIAVVLVQPAEAGGFLGSGSGNMSNMMAPRRSADVLTRLTAILAGVFFMTSLTLAIMAEHGGSGKKSIIDAVTEQTQQQPAASAVVKTESSVSKKVVAPKKEKPTAPISK